VIARHHSARAKTLSGNRTGRTQSASEPVKRVTIMMGYRGMLTMLSQVDFGHHHNRKKIVGTQASIEEKRRKVI